MMTISFVSEEEKQQLIEQHSNTYELIETRYLFAGNELVFREKVSGLTANERIESLEQSIAELTAVMAMIMTP